MSTHMKPKFVAVIYSSKVAVTFHFYFLKQHALDIKNVKSSLPSYNVKDFHTKQQEGMDSTKTGFFFCFLFVF